MLKEKENPKKWEIGDTFYYKIENYSEELDGRYMLFIKADIYNDIPSFRVKVTPYNKLPKTKEELELLGYARLQTRLWEQRFSPLNGKLSIEKLIEERNKVKFYPDENGILYIYQVMINITSRKHIPKEWEYLGNFNLSLPIDEYIPFQKFDIWGFIWNYGSKYLLDKYVRYNGSNRDYIEIAKKRRRQEQEVIRCTLSYFNKNIEEVDKIMDIITTLK